MMNTVYVSKQGSDTNIGSAAQPFATIQMALKAMRVSAYKGLKKIVISEGEYFLDMPIELDYRDEGLTIEAKANKVVLFGGCKIGNWKKEDFLYTATIDGVEDRIWDFRTLLVNGRFCERARLPETGRYEHLSKFDVGWATSIERPCRPGFWREPSYEEVTTLKFRPNDLPIDMDIKNAELTIFNCWETSLVGIKSINWQTNMIRFINRSGMPPGAFSGHEYCIWNVKEGMQKPGKWFLDRTNSKVVYWPLPGEDMRTAEVIAPKIESIIRLLGTKEQPVKNITIRGLNLSMTTTRLEGVKEAYGEILNYDGGDRTGRLDGILFATYIQGCIFEDMELAYGGGQGIKMYEVDDTRIERCNIHHMGGRGVTLLGHGTVLNNCHIHNIGVVYPAVEAVAVRGQYGEGITVSNCEIHDVSYTAIHVITAHNHVIENNLVYNAMKVMRDGAGIYLSFCHYVTVRGNFVHDIEIDPISKTVRKRGEYHHTQAHAYYLDEESENCILEGNLSLNCPSPYQGHQARNNIIRNNFFINDEDDVLWHMPLSWSETLEKNIFYSGKGAVLFGNPKAVVNFNNNILYSGNGRVVGYDTFFYNKTNEVSLGTDGRNSFADPLFIIYCDGNVKFADNSPARYLGIEEIDVSMAGIKQ